MWNISINMIAITMDYGLWAAMQLVGVAHHKQL